MRPGLRFAVLTRDNYTCRYCGAKAPDVKLHVDHVLPKSKGGKDALDNLVTACATCNQGKHATLTEQATPSVSRNDLLDRLVEVIEKRSQTFWYDHGGLNDEWFEITGHVAAPKTQLMFAEMLVWASFSEIRRAMYVAARRLGFMPGQLCECTEEDDCEVHVPIDIFEVQMTVKRWHEEWFI